MVLMVASLDAMPYISRKTHIALNTYLALWMTWFCIRFQFLISRENDVVLPIDFTDSEISCQARLANASLMVSIFLWKQAISSYRQKGRCTSVVYTIHPMEEENANVGK